MPVRRQFASSEVVHKHAKKNAQTSVDILSNTCLWRLHLYQHSDNMNEHTFQIVMHHLITDGYSMPIYFQQLAYYYNENKQRVHKSAYSYVDYSQWYANVHAVEGNFEKEINYWKHQLDGYEYLELITDKSRPAVIDYAGNLTRCIIN